MKKFVLVGGVDPHTTLDFIDKEIIRITEKRNPKILFIPTASDDDIKYCERYRDIYTGRFGCEIDFLYLIKESPGENEIRDKIFKSDIIYIGGGPLSRVMEYFDRFNMKDILLEASNKGIVIAGISSGAICLGQYYFHMKHYSSTEAKKYFKTDCLGLFKLLIVPHYNLEDYSDTDMISSMINESELLCIGLENNSALEIIGDTYRIITSRDTAKAYIIYKKDGQLVKEVIKEKNEFMPIDELINVKVL